METNFPFGTHGVKEGKGNFLLLHELENWWSNFSFILNYFYFSNHFGSLLHIYKIRWVHFDGRWSLRHHGTQHFVDSPWTHIFRRNFFVVLWLSKWSQKTKQNLLLWTVPSALPTKSLTIWNGSIIKYIFPAPHLISGKVKSILHMLYNVHKCKIACAHLPQNKKTSQKSLWEHIKGGKEGKAKRGFLSGPSTQKEKKKETSHQLLLTN